MIRSLLVVAMLSGCSEPRRQSAVFDASPAVVTAEPADCPEPPAPIELPCDEPDAEPTGAAVVSRGDDALVLERVDFDRLPGWGDDRHARALIAFAASCKKLSGLKDSHRISVTPYAGRVKHWRRPCREARSVPAGDDAAARAFFESEFRAYAASGKTSDKAKFSGYYVQPLRGSRQRHGPYQIPIHARPDDLVSVQLSEFIDDGRGRRIWGRFDRDTGQLVPYPTRAQMRRRQPDDRGVLLWVDDPVDAVFAEIQGSGVVEMDDGSVVWIGFAGKNGRRFRGVGGILRRMGELARGQGTMQGVRAWFEANPDRYHEIVDRNPAKVFFEIQDRAGAIGTQGVVLTPRRSMAIDRAAIAFSTPIWVDTRAPVGAGGRVVPWRRLLVAQDTGGAILGPVRGDIYWGDDLEAARIAGRMGGPGRMWLLLPRAVRIAGQR